MLPIDNVLWLPPITHNIYRWGDCPFYGLDQVKELDIESKRQILFGRCEIERCIDINRPLDAIVFCNYIDLDLSDLIADKIFLPTYYLEFAEQLKKQFDEHWQWPVQRECDLCCTMLKPRYPRIIASCWLANHSQDIRIAYTQNWQPNDHTDALYELLQIGGLKDWTNDWGPKLLQMPAYQIPDPKPDADIDDIGIQSLRFQNLYPEIYSKAASAVVIGAVSWEWACEICEKYLFAVYGGCIPIVHGYKIYDRLRDLGFDTFEDIIDTSSQYDKNPITASWNMLNRNLNFFKQARSIVKKDSIQSRLRHNFNLAQDVAAVYKNSLSRLNSPTALEIFNNHKFRIWEHFAREHKLDFAKYE